MENKELFEISANGFDCEQVEQYITILKAQYKKVFEYAKATEANNEKLKKICRSLSDENKALKASGASVDSAVKEEPAENGIDKIIRLANELAKEAESLR